MQRFDIILHPLNELRLILAYSATDVRSHEQRVETREDAEHFVGVLGRPQLVAEVGSDASLNAICTNKT